MQSLEYARSTARENFANRSQDTQRLWHGLRSVEEQIPQQGLAQRWEKSTRTGAGAVPGQKRPHPPVANGVGCRVSCADAGA
jgi:hypothetical protein